MFSVVNINTPVPSTRLHGIILKISCSCKFMVMVLVTPVVDLVVLTAVRDNAINCACSEKCLCLELLFVPLVCTYSYIQ
jgi:hypothetical protein